MRQPQDKSQDRLRQSSRRPRPANSGQAMPVTYLESEPTMAEISAGLMPQQSKSHPESHEDRLNRSTRRTRPTTADRDMRATYVEPESAAAEVSTEHPSETDSDEAAQDSAARRRTESRASSLEATTSNGSAGDLFAGKGTPTNPPKPAATISSKKLSDRVVATTFVSRQPVASMASTVRKRISVPLPFVLATTCVIVCLALSAAAVRGGRRRFGVGWQGRRRFPVLLAAKQER